MGKSSEIGFLTIFHTISIEFSQYESVLNFPVKLLYIKSNQDDNLYNGCGTGNFVKIFNLI
jgi:hypothetical protein